MQWIVLFREYVLFRHFILGSLASTFLFHSQEHSIYISREYDIKEKTHRLNNSLWVNIIIGIGNYIIPGIPPPIPPGIPPCSSGMSISAHSVVKIIPATEAAFSKATLVTFLGSIIPAFSMST